MRKEGRRAASPRAPPSVSRGSGAVLEAPLLEPLLLGAEPRQALESHVRRKRLQLEWGLPAPVRSSLRTWAPALLPAFPGPEQEQEPPQQEPGEGAGSLFRAERRRSLERHLKEKLVHRRWGLPRGIRAALRAQEKEQEPRARSSGTRAPREEEEEAAPDPTKTATTTPGPGSHREAGGGGGGGRERAPARKQQQQQQQQQPPEGEDPAPAALPPGNTRGPRRTPEKAKAAKAREGGGAARGRTPAAGEEASPCASCAGPARRLLLLRGPEEAGPPFRPGSGGEGPGAPPPPPPPLPGEDQRRYFELHLREKLLHQRWGPPRRVRESLARCPDASQAPGPKK